jgi:hypothetical protein
LVIQATIPIAIAEATVLAVIIERNHLAILLIVVRAAAAQMEVLLTPTIQAIIQAVVAEVEDSFIKI